MTVSEPFKNTRFAFGPEMTHLNLCNPCGLVNHGNICYLNSILQGGKSLSRFFSNSVSENHELVLAFQLIILAMSEQARFVDLLYFINSFQQTFLINRM